MPSKKRSSAHDKNILEAADEARSKRERPRQVQKRADERYRDRTRRVSTAFKKRLIARALRAADIDVDAITTRHEKARKGTLAYLKKEKQAAQSAAKEANRRLAADVATRTQTLTRRAGLVPAPQQPTIYAVLDKAARITRTTSPIVAGQNVGKLWARVQYSFASSSVTNYGEDEGTWDFIWTPPRNGFLRVTGFVNLNGVHQIYQDDDCNVGKVAASVYSSISLFHTYSDNQSIQDSVPIYQHSDSVDKGAWDSGGDSSSYRYTESVIGVYDRDFFVEAQRPVAISVVVSAFIHAQSGGGEIDFTSGAFQVSVPLVFLALLP